MLLAPVHADLAEPIVIQRCDSRRRHPDNYPKIQITQLRITLWRTDVYRIYNSSLIHYILPVLTQSGVAYVAITHEYSSRPFGCLITKARTSSRCSNVVSLLVDTGSAWLIPSDYRICSIHWIIITKQKLLRSGSKRKACILDTRDDWCHCIIRRHLPGIKPFTPSVSRSASRLKMTLGETNNGILHISLPLTGIDMPVQNANESQSAVSLPARTRSRPKDQWL